MTSDTDFLPSQMDGGTYERIVAEAKRRRRRRATVRGAIAGVGAVVLVVVGTSALRERGTDPELTFQQSPGMSVAPTGIPDRPGRTTPKGAFVDRSIECVDGDFMLTVEMRNSGDVPLAYLDASIFEVPEAVVTIEGSPAAPGDHIWLRSVVPGSTIGQLGLRVEVPSTNAVQDGTVAEVAAPLFTASDLEAACP